MPTRRAHALSGGSKYVLALAGISMLALGLAYPLWHLCKQSLSDGSGLFVGFRNFYEYFSTPGLVSAFTNTISIGVLVTAITLFAAFTLAYALTHGNMKGRRLAQGLSLLPLFVPSIFPALGLIYLLGEQGCFKFLLSDGELYGPIGITLGSIVYALPHAVLILVATLRDVDHNLYLAARTLGASPFKRFITVTLPNCAYGITSAGIVVFILTITDFGVPKVLGGNYAMLSTEIFKQVIGMQNFAMGSTASILLLLPTILAFVLDNWAKGKQRARGAGAKAAPERSTEAGAHLRDFALTLAGWLVLALPLAVIGMVVWGSLVNFWPYDTSLSLINYGFEQTLYGMAPYWNSLILACSVAVLGTALIFACAYLFERVPMPGALGKIFHLLALLPLSVPGTVLGLAFVLAFNDAPALSWLVSDFNGFGFLAFNTIVHFYTVCHLTCVGSLNRLPANFEAAGKTLGVSQWRTFFKVILPLQKNILLDVGFYLFVNALTTISALIFLYSADNIPASISILQMFDSGQIAEASAMGVLILLSALAIRALLAWLPKCLVHIFNKQPPP